MIKLILFDLDGVLVEAKHIHYESLNTALREIDARYIITEYEHLKYYDGLKTFEKLDRLTTTKGLPKSCHSIVWKRKQELTQQKILNLMPDENLINVLKKLKTEFTLGCCTNSISQTVKTILNKLNIINYFDLILSNEDVKNPKPHPEIYWTAMSMLGALPGETLILEDAPPGLLAANRSGANILRIKSPKDISIDNILKRVYNTRPDMNKWQATNMNVLIPMAGAGSRFEKAGYTFPKPLIDVNGKPMIQVVVDNLNIDANFIFIVQKEHRQKYNLDGLLNLIAPGCSIIDVCGVTEGAACTTLLAKELINNDKPLLIANSDQFVEWNSNEFMYKVQEQDVDAGILTFESTHPKWSYVKLNSCGYVEEVAEKNPISNNATVGIYYWKKGRDYVQFAEQMIEKNNRVNNEFYVCPVFNEAILDKKKIITYSINKMWGLGTPEDLNYFLKNTYDNNFA